MQIDRIRCNDHDIKPLNITLSIGPLIECQAVIFDQTLRLRTHLFGDHGDLFGEIDQFLKFLSRDLTATDEQYFQITHIHIHWEKRHSTPFRLR